MSERLRQTIADRLKALRAKKGVRQEDVAEATSISLSAIRKYETNQRDPEKENLAKLANYFEVDASYLEYGIVQNVETQTRLPKEVEEFAIWLSNYNITETDIKRIRRMVSAYLRDDELTESIRQAPLTNLTTQRPMGVSSTGKVWVGDTNGITRMVGNTEENQEQGQPPARTKTRAELRQMVEEFRRSIPYNQGQLDDALEVLTALLENQGQIPTAIPAAAINATSGSGSGSPEAVRAISLNVAAVKANEDVSDIVQVGVWDEIKPIVTRAERDTIQNPDRRNK